MISGIKLEESDAFFDSIRTKGASLEGKVLFDAFAVFTIT